MIICVCVNFSSLPVCSVMDTLMRLLSISRSFSIFNTHTYIHTHSHVCLSRTETCALPQLSPAFAVYWQLFQLIKLHLILTSWALGAGKRDRLRVPGHQRLYYTRLNCLRTRRQISFWIWTRLSRTDCRRRQRIPATTAKTRKYIIHEDYTKWCYKQTKESLHP